MGLPYGKPTDIWSLGIIAYMLIIGFRPFDDYPESEIVK